VEFFENKQMNYEELAGKVEMVSSISRSKKCRKKLRGKNLS